MDNNLKLTNHNLIKATQKLEILLSWIIIIVTSIFVIISIFHFLGQDWTQITTYYSFINRILLIVIGFELVRMLLIHNLTTLLEIMAFVIARKLLLPELEMFDIVIGVLAFSVLVFVRLKVICDQEK